MKVYDPCSKDLKNLLEKLLCKENYLIVCIGSWLRMDDRAGLEVCNLISLPTKSVICEYGLENCLGELVESKASNLLLIDAVVSGGSSPGSIIYTDINEVSNGFLATTHNIPVNTVIKYLRTLGIASNVKVLGIRVKSLDFGDTITPEVSRSVVCLSSTIRELLSKCKAI